MQDFYQAPDRPSAAKPMLFGAAFGLAAILVFFVAYLIAPNLSLAGTSLVAVAMLAVVAIALNYVPSRAGEDLAALAMGELPPHERAAEADGVATEDRPTKESLDARADELRRRLDGTNRAEKPIEFIVTLRELGDTQKQLGTLAMEAPGLKQRKTAFAYLRQAANSYRKVVGSRGKNPSDRDWALAQIALAECQLVLGEADNARDEVLTAVNGFTAALEVAGLSPEERRAGEAGLAQAEGVLASMGEDDRSNAGDDLG